MSKDIKKALEHCIEWNCADCPNREELGSGETVCRGRLLPEVLEYVADLEAKLAESEHRNEQLVDALNGKVFINYKLPMENAQLKQQLAESEHKCRECKHLNKKIELNIKNKLMAENCELQKQLAEKTLTIEQINKAFIENRSLWKGKYERANQDKISFAVEVLKIAQDYVQQYVNNFDDMNDCLCAIDNQIKRLTHQHEYKGE